MVMANVRRTSVGGGIGLGIAWNATGAGDIPSLADRTRWSRPRNVGNVGERVTRRYWVYFSHGKDRIYHRYNTVIHMYISRNVQ